MKSDKVPHQTAFLFYPKVCIFIFVSEDHKSFLSTGSLMLVAMETVDFLKREAELTHWEKQRFLVIKNIDASVNQLFEST